MAVDFIGGTTTIRFTRSRGSTDTNDISLDECRYFLWAWGGVGDYSDPATVMYHGSNRGNFANRICIPGTCVNGGKYFRLYTHMLLYHVLVIILSATWHIPQSALWGLAKYIYQWTIIGGRGCVGQLGVIQTELFNIPTKSEAAIKCLGCLGLRLSGCVSTSQGYLYHILTCRLFSCCSWGCNMLWLISYCNHSCHGTKIYFINCVLLVFIATL